MAVSDEELLERFLAQRNQEDFEELIGRHKDFAYRVAMGVCGNMALAEDVVQESFIQLLRERVPYRNGGVRSFRSWFYKFVTNVARQGLRSERRTKMRESSARYQDRVSPRLNEERSDVADDSEESRHALHKALASLSSDQRLAVVLHFMEGLSQAEVGEMIGASQAQVSRRIAQGLELLRLRMAEGGVAVSAVALPCLLKMEGLLQAPPALTQKLLGLRLGEVAANVADASRRLATAKAGSTFAWLAAATLILSAGAAVWWSVSDKPQHVAAIPPNSLIEQPAPTKNEPAETVSDDGPFSKSWKAPMDFPVIQGVWTYQPEGKYPACMLTDPKEHVIIQIPVPVARKPAVIVCKMRHVTIGGWSCTAYYGSKESIAEYVPHTAWLKYHKSSLPHTPPNVTATVRWYILGQYLAATKDGAVFIVRKHEQPYPSDRLMIALKNWQVEEIEYHSLHQDELPSALKDFDAAARKLGVEPMNIGIDGQQIQP